MRTKMIDALLIDTQNGGARYTVKTEAYWDQTRQMWVSPKTIDHEGYRYAFCGRLLDAERTPYYQTSVKL